MSDIKLRPMDFIHPMSIMETLSEAGIRPGNYHNAYTELVGLLDTWSGKHMRDVCGEQDEILALKEALRETQELMDRVAPENIYVERRIAKNEEIL